MNFSIALLEFAQIITCLSGDLLSDYKSIGYHVLLTHKLCMVEKFSVSDKILVLELLTSEHYDSLPKFFDHVL